MDKKTQKNAQIAVQPEPRKEVLKEDSKPGVVVIVNEDSETKEERKLIFKNHSGKSMSLKSKL